MNRYMSVLAVVVVFGGLGTWLLAGSHASTSTASVETENGTVSSVASNVTDITASGSHAVKFGITGGSGPVNGLLTSDSNYFPLTVWLQTPLANAANYKAVGINQFTELYNSDTTADMNALIANNQLINLSEQSAFTLNPAYNNV